MFYNSIMDNLVKMVNQVQRNATIKLPTPTPKQKLPKSTPTFTKSTILTPQMQQELLLQRPVYLRDNV